MKIEKSHAKALVSLCRDDLAPYCAVVRVDNDVLVATNRRVLVRVACQSGETGNIAKTTIDSALKDKDSQSIECSVEEGSYPRYEAAFTGPTMSEESLGLYDIDELILLLKALKIASGKRSASVELKVQQGSAGVRPLHAILRVPTAIDGLVCPQRY